MRLVHTEVQDVETTNRTPIACTNCAKAKTKCDREVSICGLALASLTNLSTTYRFHVRDVGTKRSSVSRGVVADLQKRLIAKPSGGLNRNASIRMLGISHQKCKSQKRLRALPFLRLVEHRPRDRQVQQKGFPMVMFFSKIPSQPSTLLLPSHYLSRMSRSHLQLKSYLHHPLIRLRLNHAILRTGLSLVQTYSRIIHTPPSFQTPATNFISRLPPR